MCQRTIRSQLQLLNREEVKNMSEAATLQELNKRKRNAHIIVSHHHRSRRSVVGACCYSKCNTIIEKAEASLAARQAPRVNLLPSQPSV
mmetsp:Transcript_20824/g.37827  ORF Transcript_20824/g.37827 Transcript_20824/m.37827 type:complete len:89 (+) Transcript_20824:94-360(+)